MGTELIEMIRDIAPEAWRIAMNQVVVNIRLNVFWAIALTVTTIVSGCIARRLATSSEDSYSDDKLIALLLVMAMAIMFIGAAVCASSAYSAIANPEYSAIRLLMPRQ